MNSSHAFVEYINTTYKIRKIESLHNVLTNTCFLTFLLLEDRTAVYQCQVEACSIAHFHYWPSVIYPNNNLAE